jgi:hypothetical protein
MSTRKRSLSEERHAAIASEVLSRMRCDGYGRPPFSDSGQNILIKHVLKAYGIEEIKMKDWLSKSFINGYLLVTTMNKGIEELDFSAIPPLCEESLLRTLPYGLVFIRTSL